MFDKLLENLDDVAGKLGLPADQVKAVTDSLAGRLGTGGDQMAALMETAQEHGLPVEKLQEILGGLGVDVEGLMGKLGDMLDGDAAQEGLSNLAGMAKGLFGKD